MSNIKKRFLIIISSLALALIMGATSDAPNIVRKVTNSVDDWQQAPSMQLAGDVEDDTGGG